MQTGSFGIPVWDGRIHFCISLPEKELFMERIKPRTLSGFMELLPADQAKMERFMETLRRRCSSNG